MLQAVGLLLRRSAVVVLIALALAALVAALLPGSFGESLQLMAFAAGGVLLLFAATGSSPAMDRAVGQETRTVVGRVMGRPDETHQATPSHSVVLLLAALIVFGIAVLIDL
jgi:hypothetical protein